jgi:hypothetical protein
MHFVAPRKRPSDIDCQSTRPSGSCQFRVPRAMPVPSLQRTSFRKIAHGDLERVSKLKFLRRSGGRRSCGAAFCACSRCCGSAGASPSPVLKRVLEFQQDEQCRSTCQPGNTRNCVCQVCASHSPLRNLFANLRAPNHNKTGARRHCELREGCAVLVVES